MAIAGSWRPSTIVARHDRPTERRWECRVPHLRGMGHAWPPGGAIELHDHGIFGAVVVAEPATEPSCRSPREGPRSLQTIGGPVLFPRTPTVHDIVNSATAISVHVYAPRLTSMTYYRLTDGSSKPGTVRYRSAEAWRMSFPSTTWSSVPPRIQRSDPTSSTARRRRWARHRHPAGCAKATEGALPGALVVERNVLEWRLDPGSEHRLPDVGTSTSLWWWCVRPATHRAWRQHRSPTWASSAPPISSAATRHGASGSPSTWARRGGAGPRRARMPTPPMVCRRSRTERLHRLRDGAVGAAPRQRGDRHAAMGL